MATNTQLGRKVQAIRQAGEGMEVPFDLSLIRKAPGFEVPEIEGTVEGWRAWTVSKKLPLYGVDPKMHSVVWNYTWYPQQVAESECGIGGHVGNHDGPTADARCSCGFYTAKTLKHLMQMGYHGYADYDNQTMVKVLGRVANWGQVTEGTQGWRSQYSYPVMLFVPYEAAHLAKPLEKAFGCKVRLLNFLKTAGSIDQLAIVRGDTMKPVKLEKGKIGGRKCKHVSKPFTGFVVGEPFDKDGDTAEWVKVRWDVRPNDEVLMRVANLKIQSLGGSF